MKTFFSVLLFDRELINGIKKTKISKEALYLSLLEGKITLEEYLAATK